MVNIYHAHLPLTDASIWATLVRMIKRYKISMTDFRKWVKGHASGQVVGERRTCNNCPVAYYLQSLGHLDAMVTVRKVWIDGMQGPGELMPLWVRLFVRAVDIVPHDYIDTEEALVALDDAEALVFLSK